MGGSVVFGDVTPHTEKWVSQIFYGLAYAFMVLLAAPLPQLQLEPTGL